MREEDRPSAHPCFGPIIIIIITHRGGHTRCGGRAGRGGGAHRAGDGWDTAQARGERREDRRRNGIDRFSLILRRRMTIELWIQINRIHALLIASPPGSIPFDEGRPIGPVNSE